VVGPWGKTVGGAAGSAVGGTPVAGTAGCAQAAARVAAALNPEILRKPRLVIVIVHSPFLTAIPASLRAALAAASQGKRSGARGCAQAASEARASPAEPCWRYIPYMPERAGRQQIRRGATGHDGGRGLPGQRMAGISVWASTVLAAFSLVPTR